MRYIKSNLSVRLCVIFILVFSQLSVANDVINMDMFVGEVRSLGKKTVNRVAVGAGSVIRAETAGPELIVIAEGAGSSYLTIWYSNGKQAVYNVRVSEHDPEHRVQMQNMIRVKVQMVEFRKTATDDLGIDWLKEGIRGPTFGAVGDLTGNTLFRPPTDPLLGLGTNVLPLEVKPFSTYFGISTAITSRINFLASRGDAITIAEPTLTVVNGGNAYFLSGGEIPYSTVSATGQVNVEFKEYGIKLNVLPRASQDGNIFTEIKTELSQPDDVLSVGGIPALLTRKTESQMNVHDGQTIVISGLLSAESAKVKNTVPGLGDIPFLGAIFSNYSFEHDITELVLFVTPEVVKGDAIGGTEHQQKLLLQSRERLQKLGKKLKYSLME